MAQLEDALQTAMTGHEGLAALVGTRIRPMQAEAGITQPYVVYRRSGADRVHAMVADPGLANASMEISSYDDSYAGVKAVAAQVRACLQDWSGTVQGVVVQRSFIAGERDGFDQGTETYWVSTVFDIWHEEA